MADLIPLQTAAGKLDVFKFTRRRGQPDVYLTPAEVSQIAAGWAAHQEAQRRKAQADAAAKKADKANEEP